MAVIRMAAKDRTVIYVETDESQGAAMALQQQEAALSKEPPNFGKIGERIATICAEVHEQIEAKPINLRPNQLTLKFGITVSGEAGIPLVVNGKVQATFEVTALWKTDS